MQPDPTLPPELAGLGPGRGGCSQPSEVGPWRLAGLGRGRARLELPWLLPPLPSSAPPPSSLPPLPPPCPTSPLPSFSLPPPSPLLPLPRDCPLAPVSQRASSLGGLEPWVVGQQQLGMANRLTQGKRAQAWAWAGAGREGGVPVLVPPPTSH